MHDESSGSSQGAPPVIVDPHPPLLESDPHNLILGTLGRGCGRHTIILERNHIAISRPDADDSGFGTPRTDVSGLLRAGDGKEGPHD